MKKQLSASKMFLLATGHMGYLFLLRTLSTYVLRFFAPTESTGLPLLLPIGVIGVIQGISIAFDAIIDPWIASVSDNSKNPKGRRIPLMRIAAIPAAVFCILVFFVPVHQPSWINVVWVLVMLFLYCLSRSFYDISIRALVPEIIPDAYKRTRYFAILAVYQIIGFMLLGTVPTIITALENFGMSSLPAWQTSLSLYPVIGVIMMLIGAFSVRETDYAEPTPETQASNGMFSSIKDVLKNKEFVTFLIGVMAFDFASGMFNAALLFIIDLLLELDAAMYTVVVVLLTVVSLILYIPILKLIKRVGKRRLMLLSILICALIFVASYFHEPLSNLLGTGAVAAGGMWAQIAGEGAKVGNIALLLILGVLFAYPQAAGGVVGSSMFADIAQYNDVITGQNRKGMVMALASIISVLPNTLVPAVLGWLLYAGSTNDMPTAFGARSTMLVSIGFIIIAYIQYFRYNEKKVFASIVTDNDK